MKKIQIEILKESTAQWFKNPAGIAASDLGRRLGLSNEGACQEVEALCDAGFGTMNRDAEFVQLSFDPANPRGGFSKSPLKTHVFFPSKKVLADAYYQSELPQQKLPEYVVRLHLGAHQYGFAHFNEEVLARYFDHPELYEVEDTLAGGSVSTLFDAGEERHLYVRYGKCRLESGHTAVNALYKDLALMGSSEQRHWHAHEIVDPSLDTADEHFQTFLSRTFDGAWVEYPDPIRSLLTEVVAINLSLAPLELFRHSENVHLRMPVEQTYKSYCDCASELYKVVGPDALIQATLKSLLRERFSMNEEGFVHNESKRPLSANQLLGLLEAKLGFPEALRGPLKKVSELRNDADHRILTPKESRSYSGDFAALCRDLEFGIAQLRRALVARVR